MPTFKILSGKTFRKIASRNEDDLNRPNYTRRFNEHEKKAFRPGYSTRATGAKRRQKGKCAALKKGKEKPHAKEVIRGGREKPTKKSNKKARKRTSEDDVMNDL